MDGSIHLRLLHVQSDRLSQCPVARVCCPPPDQGVRDTHPGETELEEVEERPGLSGIHAENLKTDSLHILGLLVVLLCLTLDNDWVFDG